MNHTDQRTDRYNRHSFMLIISCALSFAAFLFAVDLSALSSETCRAQAGTMAAQQLDKSPALPSRQQSTPAVQPIRAVLTELIAAKIKLSSPQGNGDTFIPFSSELVLSGGKPVEAATRLRFFTASPGHYACARAPPKTA
ncbi:hypothetical protein ACFQ3K_14965 [Brucella gallinifaecis]|uniref:Uncharacterized protein n=1 Tax=Brucella gallinifaecis TaxID=215590 RepID=A0A502BUL0_9HYPH|nr:hypothetical protein [Brucella gallinifaecis]TPF76758.1 hypothetical protein FHY56_04520 [Brucella gallinifaecis]